MLLKRMCVLKKKQMKVCKEVHNAHVCSKRGRRKDMEGEGGGERERLVVDPSFYFRSRGDLPPTDVICVAQFLI